MKAALPLVFASAAYAVSLPNFLSVRDTNNWFTCPAENPITCGTTTNDNTCCFESPGGVIVQAQAWDYAPATGSASNFTLKGLWPALCNGTFQGYCDSQINVNASSLDWIIATEFGDQRVLDRLHSYWKNPAGSDEELWAEEFNEHASCISTIRPECWGENYEDDEHIYTYFELALDLYDAYPTFDVLSAAGITPSLIETYTADQISQALTSSNDGYSVYFGCDATGALNEIRYYHHFQGPLVIESYYKIDALAETNCPSTGIRFVPKIFSEAK